MVPLTILVTLTLFDYLYLYLVPFQLGAVGVILSVLGVVRKCGCYGRVPVDPNPEPAASEVSAEDDDCPAVSE